MVALKLKSDFLTYSLPATGCCFPSLKFLHFATGHDSNRSSLENLFRSCPVLEELTIEGHYKQDVLNFNISPPELKTLQPSLQKKNIIMREGEDSNKW